MGTPSNRNPRREAAGLLKYAFVGPALVFLIAFNIFPLVYSIVLSFTDARLSGGPGGRPPSFVGTMNYAEVFTEPKYADSLRTTAVFVIGAVAAELVLGFLAALALRDALHGKKALLTVLLVPMMLSQAVMGLFWHLILHGDYGVLNQALAALGLGQPQWLTDTRLKLLSILIIDVWMWTPFMMLIALAGLNSIPRHLYEAAEIDRAGAWTVFRRITLPLCAPLLLLAVLLRMTDALKQFDLVMALTGPNDAATQTLSALIYQTGIRGSNLGLGTAYSYVVLVLVVALATMFIRYIDWVQRSQGRVQG